MYRGNFLIYSILIFIIASSCSKSNDKITIIPEPNHIKSLIGTFEFNDSTVVLFDSKEEEDIANYFCSELKKLYGLDIKPQNLYETHSTNNKLNISLGFCHNDVGGEGYYLTVDDQEINLCANLKVGLFYGVQSLLQLFPADNDSILELPCVEIVDMPEFLWRGAQLDVATHFFNKEFIKKYIDVLAMHKINVLELQLANDYAWRMEIKEYPKLTEIGAWREDRRNEQWSIQESQRPTYNPKKPYYGGFYTQDDLREIVSYAKQRFVSIVPQIQFPTNITPILAAYPELSCSGEKPKIIIGRSKIGTNALCLGNDSSYVFIKNVINEIIDVFPNSSIHIDGYMYSKAWKDCEKCQAKKKEEGLKTDQDLLKYFFSDIEAHILSRGRTIIGTEAMLFQKLQAGAVISIERNQDLIKQISEQNYKVICSPVDKYLFSSYQDDKNQEPEAFPNIITLQDVYLSDPLPKGIDKEEYYNILGIQTKLFTDFIQTPKMAEYMLFPRICAFSERAWSKPETKNWQRFEAKMNDHYYRLDKKNINYYVPAPLGLKDEVIYDEDLHIELHSAKPNLEIHYTLDGTVPVIESPLYKEPIIISETSTLKAKSFLPNGMSSNLRVARFTKTAARETLTDLVNLYPGIQYHYYNGIFRSVDEIYNVSPAFTKVIKKITIPDNIYRENFGLVFEGVIFVEKEGIYSFFITSDDGSRLYLGGEVVIDNDGIHGPAWVEGQVALKAGYHSIKIEYFDLNLNETLKLEYEGPGIERKEVPENILFYMNVKKDEFMF